VSRVWMILSCFYVCLSVFLQKECMMISLTHYLSSLPVSKVCYESTWNDKTRFRCFFRFHLFFWRFELFIIFFCLFFLPYFWFFLFLCWFIVWCSVCLCKWIVFFRGPYVFCSVCVCVCYVLVCVVVVGLKISWIRSTRLTCIIWWSSGSGFMFFINWFSIRISNNNTSCTNIVINTLTNRMLSKTTSISN